MPRKAREQSRTNIYHVMIRGINRQIIFEDNEDMYVFMTALKRCKELSDFKLYAFCLMPNHVHLLMKTNQEPLEIIFKRLGSKYAGWYNLKYERVGHLFQDRFRSEKVETEAYFRTVLRYIIQNPMKAHMEEKPGTYKWSSYLAYEKGAGMLTDTQYAIDLFGQRDALIDFLCESNEEKVMDEEDFAPRLSDLRAKEIMEKITHCSSVPEFQRLEKDIQREYILDMYDNGMPFRQISRLTGKDRKTIAKTVQQKSAADELNLKENEFPDLENSLALRESDMFEVIW